MGLFGRLKTLVKGKADEAVEKMEDDNLVMVAKQHIQDAKVELNKATANVGQIKGTVMTLEGKKKRLEDELANETSKAKTLKAKADGFKEAGDDANYNKWFGHAQEIAEGCVDIKGRIASMESQIATMQEKSEQQEALVRTLRTKVKSGEHKLQQMKANEQVTKAQEALSEVNTDGTQSALSKFDEMLEKQETKMHASSAMLDAQSGTNSEIEDALASSKANDFLDSL